MSFLGTMLATSLVGEELQRMYSMHGVNVGALCC